MPQDNPYLPPTATTQPPQELPTIDVPEEVLKKIKGAWIAALISSAMTLIFVGMAMSGNSVYNFNAWMLIDVALLLGLAFGIFMKSRTCAVVLLCYFIYSKIELMAQGAPASSLPMALVFLYFYWQGVVGTFKYQSLLKDKL